MFVSVAMSFCTARPFHLPHHTDSTADTQRDEMNRNRVSTNVKLAAIIHSNAEDSPEAEEDFKQIEKLAKQRLRRACLYGGGARTLVPKIKKTAKKSLQPSPFVLPGAPQDPPPPLPLMTSIPPCAHEQQFLMVRNPTTAAANDPDRFCYNTAGMLDGHRHVSQPPWYVGYGNKTVPPDSSIAISAARYGYRGSRKIEQFNTKPYEHPSKTRTEYTPKFLNADEQYVDEWVPPIIASTVDSVNGIETPKLWPENTIFVSGYKKKELPSSWRYKRETTVDQSAPPISPESLSQWMSTCREEQDLLRTAARDESLRRIKSLPIDTKEKITQTWKRLVDKNATNALKQTMRDTHAPYDPHTLLDPSDSMRYSGSTALIVHTQSTEELKFRLRMERSKSKVNTPHTLKWQHVIGHYRNIERKLKRGQKMTDVTKKVADTLQEVAIRGGSETSIRRAEFIQACHRIALFEDVGGKLLSQLFSLFDPMNKDVMRFVELIYMFTALDRPEQEPVEKIMQMWGVAQQYGLDRNSFDLLFEILCCCASSLSEVSEIESLFKSQFRPKCYEYSVNGGRFKPKTLRPLPMSSPSSAANSVSSVSPRPSTVPALPAKVLETFSAKKTSSMQHQFNICDEYLNESSLVEILQQCPELVAAFDDQLSERLVQCFGQDVRRIAEEEEVTDTSNLDFSWIMKREAPKREVFGLF